MSLESMIRRIVSQMIGQGKKIPDLPSATTPLSGTEELELVQGGVSKKTSAAALASGGSGVLTIVAGTNVTVDATDPQNPIVSSSGGGEIGSTTTSTAGGTITFNFSDNIIVVFTGTASFATPKSLAFSNDTNALKFDFLFEITDVAATLDVTGFLMSDVRRIGNDWIADEIGLYKMSGVRDTAGNWWIDISSAYI